MATNRSIDQILLAEKKDMGGFPIRQAFPSNIAASLDPFLLLHHAIVKVPTHIPTNHAGVGPHPHRGFSPVTFIFKGGVHHRDSRGNNNIIYAGGVQWMNAGMGIIHSERPPIDIHEMGGVQEIIQLWVNTPAAHKMDQPQYIPATKEMIPTVTSSDGKVAIHINSGELEGVAGPIQHITPVNTYTALFQENGSYTFSIPATHQAFVYILDGAIRVNEQDVETFHAITFKADGEQIEIMALKDSKLLIATGAPLREKIASNGPFVMNDETEILQAFRDYQMGKMGVLIED